LPASQRLVPLCPTPLLVFSLTPQNGVSSGFSGVLSTGGLANASIALPADPALCGLVIGVSGIVLEATAPDGVFCVIDHRALRLF
jgi:hypothetical protein